MSDNPIPSPRDGSSGSGVSLSSVAGSAGSFVLGQLGQDLNMQRQRKLLDYQYDSWLQRLRDAGATPSAIVQALTGQQGSMPSVSSTPSVPDLGANLVSARDVESQSERRDVENQKDFLSMNWQPRLWQAEINASYMSSLKAFRESKYFDSLSSYYGELEKDVRMKRPWQIATLSKGLEKASAEIDSLIAQRSLWKHQEGYFDAAAANQWNQSIESGYRTENLKEDLWTKTFNNILRQHGWIPEQAPWNNIARIAFTDPDKARTFLANGQVFLNHLDNKFRETFGKHYLRNLKIAGSLYYFNNRIGKHMTANSYRLRNAAGIIQGFIPFAGGSNGASSVMPYWQSSSMGQNIDFQMFNPYSGYPVPLVPYGNMY